ncbi:hypothetical protein LSCM1_05069 [Leishmania martiniquensis]|uniref:Uncharacterized protein n=1 Tax=Leishmania martiniquensis TaxID=1580590 RepID=A0A836KKL5_9TRYP|nr:hypothetical protein LSCM1_05069 [Leishmania martiniquensis]
MAHVYLLDVSYLASFEEGLPQKFSALPLSWRCAAELAQWTSVAAVRDAWVAACAETATATTEACVSTDVNFVTTGVASREPEQEGYVQQNSDADSAEANSARSCTLAAAEVGASRPCVYAMHTFPSAVPIKNRYFSAALTLVTGAPLRSCAGHGDDSLSAADPCDITADLLRKCPCSQGSHSKAYASHDGGYGGVLLARITQDPASVPWHAFPRSECLLHVIVVFHSGVADGCEAATAMPRSLACVRNSRRKEGADRGCRPSRDGAMSREESLEGAPAPLQELKERWNYFAAENGYECVFHATVYPSRAAAFMERGGRAVGNSVEEAALECVSVASGGRGLLEAPLTGSNRLYQLLCNTLWPAGVRRSVVTASARQSGDRGGEARNIVAQTPTPLKPHTGSAFVVVSDDEEAMWRLFQQRGDDCTRVRRRRLRFFTCAVPVSANLAAGARHTRVALVNQYYAAVVQPRLVQTAFFDVHMRELLDRHWEQHMTADSESDGLCPDAPAVVLWPPNPSASRTARSERKAQVTAAICGDADDKDVRSVYPPLEVILDSLARLGCRNVVVVEGEHRGGAALSGLTKYEALMCEERGIEVVQLDPARCTATSAGAAEMDVDAPPQPVVRDEDDIWATRGVDRLHELLHTVQWGQMHRMACAASPTGRLADRGRNSGLLLACGRTPFEEEAWVRDVLAALTASPSSTRRESATVSAEEYLRLAAPTVAAALGVALRKGTTDLGEGTSGAAVSVDVSNSYFAAGVDVYLEGGLQSYYAAPPSPRSGTRTMPPGWEDAHDAYVVVTTLCALQEAARTIGGPSQYTMDTDSSTAGTVGGAHAILGEVISTLARRQRGQWLGEQINAHVAHSTSQVSDMAADAPLVLLYIADVPATDTRRVELAEQLVCALARPTAACAATSFSANRSGISEDADDCVPMELVFTSEAPSLRTRAATAARGAGPVEDGTARVCEAFEQHVWPHRQALPHLRRRAGKIPHTTPNCFVEGGAPASPPPGAAAVEVSTTTKASAAVPREAVTVDIPWRKPVIGCALPGNFLVDPETLRSVPVRAMRNAPRNAGEIADGHSVGAECRESASAAPASHRKSVPEPLDEEELMQWMEKMKRYGHRLGEALRKEQAEVLALALERML